MQTFLKVPRRVHNALLIVTALAEHHGEGGFVPLAQIARDAKVSQGFLEEIAGELRQAGLISAKRGAHGGYVLLGDPADVTVGDVIRAVEGPQALAVPPSDDVVAGALSARCPSWTVWQNLHRKIADTLSATTLADLAATREGRRISA